jgi:16S rRNA G966 N2-methylase RsmD
VALRALRANVDGLGLAERARLVRGDAAGAVGRLAAAGERFAVVFADPPYASPRGRAALERLSAGDCLAPGALVVVQHATKAPPPGAPGVLAVWKARRFGETTLTFFRGPA